ncbi:hypothetical protein [Intestinibacter bartlettii]|uniref:hypothetical protein n=1 Tax=Intestinibacter bartlettii TaxID=261299 RepID=UPI0039F5C138
MVTVPPATRIPPKAVLPAVTAPANVDPATNAPAAPAVNTVAAPKATTPAVIATILPILPHKPDDFFLNLN